MQSAWITRGRRRNVDRSLKGLKRAEGKGKKQERKGEERVRRTETFESRPAWSRSQEDCFSNKRKKVE